MRPKGWEGLQGED